MTKKQRAQNLLKAVEAAILEITEGAASASVSSGSGSKSYTRADIGTLERMRTKLRQEIRAYGNNGRPAITVTGARFV